MLKKIYSLLLIVALSATTILTTACPSKSVITKAINAAEKIDSITATAVAVTNSAFAEGLISFDQKEILLPKLDSLAKGSLAFKNAALTLKAEYDKDIPKDKLQILSRMLEADVIAPFLEVLSELKLIKNTSKILAAIGLINVALVSILQAFEKEETIARINLKWKEADICPVV